MFGVLLNEYKDNFYYWEFVKMLTRNSVLNFFILFGDNVIVKGLFATFIILSYSEMSQKYKPFKLK